MEKITLLRQSEEVFFRSAKELARNLDAGIASESGNFYSSEDQTIKIVGRIFVLPESCQFELHVEEEGYIVGSASNNAIEQILRLELIGRLCSAEILIGEDGALPTLVFCEAASDGVS